MVEIRQVHLPLHLVFGDDWVGRPGVAAVCHGYQPEPGLMRTFFRVRWIHRVLSLEPKKHFPDLVSTFPVNFHVKWLL